MGALSPSYDLDFQERRCARAFADHASVTGSDYTDGSGAQSLTEYCDSTVLTVSACVATEAYLRADQLQSSPSSYLILFVFPI